MTRFTPLIKIVPGAVLVFASASPTFAGIIRWRFGGSDLGFATYGVVLTLIGAAALLWRTRSHLLRPAKLIRFALCGAALLAVPAACLAATVTIDFEGIARPGRTTPAHESNFGEEYNPFSSQGFVFPGPYPGQLFLVDRDYELNPLGTGTDYLSVQNPAWLNISSERGPFRLGPFEVGLIGFRPPSEAAIFMLGMRNDGEILQATFDAPRRRFRPIVPGREWTQLDEVWFRSINFVGYDNFTFIEVPEPTTLGLASLPGLALLFVGLARIRRRTSR